MPNYYFGGVNASGKTAILEQLVSSDKDGRWEIIAGSTELMKWFGITDGDYDSLNYLSIEQKNFAYGELVLEKINNNKSGKSLIFNSHYLNAVHGLIYKTITGSWIKNLDALVLVESRPETIIERIEHDPTRMRNLFQLKQSHTEQLKLLSEYLEKTKKEFGKLALKYSLPNLTIQNNQNELDISIEQFINFDKMIRS
jgi:adenylate kinase